ncbi:MAG: radical SAM family heme chaperone HemW [Pseudomonadota bacterium]
MIELFGVYVHWPFCASKCPYCDFNSHVVETVDHQAWRDAYAREIKYYAGLLKGQTVTSIFLGGGTPSLMQPDTVQHVIDTIAEHWGVSPDIEITLEANPTSVEAEKFRAFRSAGVNRVSLGVQSLNDEDLKFLGRQHSAIEAIEAIKIAQKTFDRYSFDLIYASPDQSVECWQRELQEALQYADGHMSLYQLTIEPWTAFHTMYQRKEFEVPDQDEGGALYEVTQQVMEAAGLSAYEVSNHAKAGQESIHNMTYWRYADYVGIGPGAHGRIIFDGHKQATRAHRAPDVWLERVQEQGYGAHPFEEINDDQYFEEYLMMGLRLREGVNIERYDNRFDHEKIRALENEGLLMFKNKTLHPTIKGLQRLNGILNYLL